MQQHFVAETVTLGDYGNAHMTAWGTSAWPTHIRSCAYCATVQQRSDARALAAAGDAAAAAEVERLTGELATMLPAYQGRAR